MLAPSMTVACGGQFRPSSVPYPTLMSSLLLCVHPLVEGLGRGGGGGGGDSTSGSEWDSAAPSFTDRSVKGAH